MGLLRRILQRLRRPIVVNWMGEARETDPVPMFLCPGCDTSKPQDGARPVPVTGGVRIECADCVEKSLKRAVRSTPITDSEQRNLHDALEHLGDLKDL